MNASGGARPILRRVITRAASLPARGLLGLLWLYRRTLSPALPVVLGPACGCRFHPTCSRYAAQAVREHGVLAGGWLSLRRLLKCQPLHPGGFDPVPKEFVFTRARRKQRKGSPPFSLFLCFLCVLL